MDHEEKKTDLISYLGAYLMDRGLTLKEAGRQATLKVEAFERSAVANWSPATGGSPDTPKLAPGDELIVVNHKTRYRPQYVQDAEVTAMARYRVTLRWTDQETGRVRTEDFDTRTRSLWTRGSDRMYSDRGGPRFYTRDQWAYHLRQELAEQYLRERGIFASSFHGPLAGAFNNDRVGLANALRRLEGLVEL